MQWSPALCKILYHHHKLYGLTGAILANPYSGQIPVMGSCHQAQVNHYRFVIEVSPGGHPLLDALQHMDQRANITYTKVIKRTDILDIRVGRYVTHDASDAHAMIPHIEAIQVPIDIQAR